MCAPEMSDESDENCSRPNLNREDQFAHVVEQTLCENGELRKLKASMRSTIMKIVRGGDQSNIFKVKEKYRNAATDLINNLIMDYFHWYGYQYSIEMFSTESGAISTDAPNRSIIGNRLAGDNTDFGKDIMMDVPILLSVVMKMLADNNIVGDGISCLSVRGNKRK